MSTLPLKLESQEKVDPSEEPCLNITFEMVLFCKLSALVSALTTYIISRVAVLFRSMLKILLYGSVCTVSD